MQERIEVALLGCGVRPGRASGIGESARVVAGVALRFGCEKRLGIGVGQDNETAQDAVAITRWTIERSGTAISPARICFIAMRPLALAATAAKARK